MLFFLRKIMNRFYGLAFIFIDLLIRLDVKILVWVLSFCATQVVYFAISYKLTVISNETRLDKFYICNICV